MNVQGLSRGFYNSWALGQAVTRYALKKYWGRQMCNLSEWLLILSYLNHHISTVYKGTGRGSSLPLYKSWLTYGPCIAANAHYNLVNSVTEQGDVWVFSDLLRRIGTLNPKCDHACSRWQPRFTQQKSGVPMYSGLIWLVSPLTFIIFEYNTTNI